MSEEKKWLCKTCKAFIGYVSADGRTVRIKYKDLFLFAEGGRVKVLCRKCATENELVDEEYMEYLKHKLKEKVETH